ncbi:hypothetical protein P6F26_08140 [Roseibacterium sp. SDUM158017]|uniref:hypothetical protein n=1 Tax=Roseicyclus salinarum TaxID=3036773 RepID=UPI0024152022|nr:hypothetical protein [Roseibacterium sp. SDUM158017]MDG4648412.1 hypothetical protein [Roseibacterium sp. SDUM158017]
MTAGEISSTRGGAVAADGPLPATLKAAILARSRARRASGSLRPLHGGAEDARIEVLGDRIEMIEFTLNEYVERIDALAAHTTRLSIDRLEIVVKDLATSIAAAVGPPAPPDATSPDGATGASDAQGRGMTSAPPGPPPASTCVDAVDLAARIAALEGRIDALSDRIRIAAAPLILQESAATGAAARLFAAFTTLARRQDEGLAHIDAKLSSIGDRLAAQEARVGPDQVEAACTHLTSIADALNDARTRVEIRLAERLEAVAASRAHPPPDEARAKTADIPGHLIDRIADRVAERLDRSDAAFPGSRDQALPRLDRKMTAHLARVERALATAAARDAALAKRLETVWPQAQTAMLARIEEAIGALRAEIAANGVDARRDLMTGTERQSRLALAELLADAARRAGPAA